MLGPFRVRNTLSPSHANRHRSALPGSSASELVVSLTGNDYDRVIQDCPESKLKYIDDDDGETVTVSTLVPPAEKLHLIFQY